MGKKGQASRSKSLSNTSNKNRKKLKIGVVTSRFNEDVTSMLEDGTIKYLQLCEAQILAIKVPGAIEIPLAVQALFDFQKVDGVIALGAVIRGETTHYEEVCRSVERNLSRLMLDYKKPIGFGVLTVENEEQAFDRIGGAHGHKGVDAAQAVIEMIGLMNNIKNAKK